MIFPVRRIDPNHVETIFNGVYVFNIKRANDTGELTLKGKIDGVKSSNSLFSNVDRELIIENSLYTISGCKLMISKIDSLSEIKALYLNGCSEGTS